MGKFLASFKWNFVRKTLKIFVKEYFQVIRDFLNLLLLEKLFFRCAFESMLTSAEICGLYLTSHRFWDTKFYQSRSLEISSLLRSSNTWWAFIYSMLHFFNIQLSSTDFGKNVAFIQNITAEMVHLSQISFDYSPYGKILAKVKVFRVEHYFSEVFT